MLIEKVRTLQYNGEKQSFLQMVLGQMDSHVQNNKFGPLSYAIHKNQLKMNLRLKFKA